MFQIPVRPQIVILLVLIGNCVMTFAATPMFVRAEVVDRSNVAAEVGDLKLQLEKGLRARRPEEFQFVTLVVTMVGNDTLPLDLVKSVFLWARKKALTTRYPFPYFERALRELASKRGIKIPS